jgi:dipeptidyl aminopeptidase/acylaminoacyl peptidase
MTDNSRATLERVARLAPVPGQGYDRFLRRRQRRDRRRRILAGTVAIVVAVGTFAALLQMLGRSQHPATSPTPTPTDRGIFTGMGGWIAYADPSGIWAFDPRDPNPFDARVRLTATRGKPLNWSSDGSKLLIQVPADRTNAHDQELIVLNQDGSKAVVQHGSWRIAGASVSPDGSKVVYAVQNPSGNRDQIWLVDSNGRLPRLLLDSRGWGLWNPNFSPDGSQIAYMEGGGDHDNTLRVMNTHGGGLRTILGNTSVMRGPITSGPSWSPDGKQLAFSNGFFRNSIFLVNVDGSNQRRLIEGTFPAWSPDGTKMYYLSGGRLAIANADGSHEQSFPFVVGDPGAWNPTARTTASVQPAEIASAGRGGGRYLLPAVIVVATGLIGFGFATMRRRRRSFDRPIG